MMGLKKPVFKTHMIPLIVEAPAHKIKPVLDSHHRTIIYQDYQS
jgi:hypothetical protein